MLILDVVAPVFFLICWAGFTYIADTHVQLDSVTGQMHKYRIEWATNMVNRDNRVVDGHILSALQRGISFFCSTTILIVAGLLALLGSEEIAQDFISGMPFAVKTSHMMWQIKVLLLILIFVYAFFKHTWALRHLNYGAILLGATPIKQHSNTQSQKHAHMLATLTFQMAKHFNRGLRAYYFGLAALTWFVHPGLFMVVSAWTTIIVYRREFKSDLKYILQKQ